MGGLNVLKKIESWKATGAETAIYTVMYDESADGKWATEPEV